MAKHGLVFLPFLFFPLGPLGLKVSRLGAFCVMRLADGLTCAIVRDKLTSSLKGGRECRWGGRLWEQTEQEG